MWPVLDMTTFSRSGLSSAIHVVWKAAEGLALSHSGTGGTDPGPLTLLLPCPLAQAAVATAVGTGDITVPIQKSPKSGGSRQGGGPHRG